jgi:hypothetical protein
MMGEAAKIKWENMNEALPAFLTIILMPLTYSITNGMIFGLLASAGFYFTTGQMFRDAQKLHQKASEVCTAKKGEEEKEPLVDAEGGTAPSNNGTFAVVMWMFSEEKEILDAVPFELMGVHMRVGSPRFGAIFW